MNEFINTKFKPFRPAILSDNSNYPSICSVCGYPEGKHNGDNNCPSIERAERDYCNIKKFILNTAKLTDKEIMIRKFRKFLYDNDVLEAWERNVKDKDLSWSRFNGKINKVFKLSEPFDWINSFSWHNKHENVNWTVLCTAWREIWREMFTE